jgi:hypothetical protein
MRRCCTPCAVPAMSCASVRREMQRSEPTGGSPSPHLSSPFGRPAQIFQAASRRSKPHPHLSSHPLWLGASHPPTPTETAELSANAFNRIASLTLSPRHKAWDDSYGEARVQGKRQTACHPRSARGEIARHESAQGVPPTPPHPHLSSYPLWVGASHPPTPTPTETAALSANAFNRIASLTLSPKPKAWDDSYGCARAQGISQTARPPKSGIPTPKSTRCPEAG